MKKWLIFCLIFCSSHVLYAKNQPLRVAVAAFSPPFVMQTTKDHFYGFDIATIEYVCQRLERRCEYIPMDANDLLRSLVAQEADVAIGGIIITLKRSRLVRFSTPYMVSKAQFLTNQDTHIDSPFNLSQLSGQRVGVLEGGALERMVRFSKTEKPKLVSFTKDTEIINALRKNRIEFAILSSPKAHYWRSNSAGLFKKIGEPFPVGFGFAVAINPEDLALIRSIDLILLDYQDSDEYKQNYNLYFRQNFQ